MSTFFTCKINHAGVTPLEKYKTSEKELRNINIQLIIKKICAIKVVFMDLKPEFEAQLSSDESASNFVFNRLQTLFKPVMLFNQSLHLMLIEALHSC